MSDVTPTEWFDQFPPLEEDSPWNTGGQWCPRHWAPCPLLGANGIGAATELMQIWVDEFKPPELGPRDVQQLRQAVEADGYLCCKLGDQRMYELWGRWGPEAADA